MEIVHNDNDLEKYLDEAIQASDSNPVLLDRFLDIATELDIEAISDGSQVEIYGVMQHIEQAGIHSGDSACSLPPYSLPDKVIKKIKEQVRVIAKEMDIIGLMNVQMAYANEEIFLLEVNPRASRTIPFVSKAIGLPLAKIASKTMIGKSLKQQKIKNPSNLNHFSVKEAVLPFDRFQNVDPILGPEMKSTGEVMGIGTSFAEAYDKSQISAGTIIPDGGSVFLSVRENDKPHLEELATRLDKLNLSIVATKGTAREIQNMGIKARIINKVAEGRPHVVDLIKNNEISLLINTTEGKESILDSSSIRRTALDNKIPCTTTLQGGLAICEVLEKRLDWSVQNIQDIHKSIE
jgi:carbamoyl-phosphate synthase large subunit